MRRAFSVAVYARKRDRVLVIAHKRTGLWLPIGGEMEAGETPLEAAVRELREETALVGVYRWRYAARDVTFLRFCFTGKVLAVEKRALDRPVIAAIWATGPPASTVGVLSVHCDSRR